MIIKLIIIIFSLFVLQRIIRQYRQNEITGREMSVWALLWLFIAVVTLMPKQSDKLAQVVGVERGADLFVYLAIIVLIFGMYKMVVRQEKLEKKITQLARAEALKKPLKVNDEDNEK